MMERYQKAMGRIHAPASVKAKLLQEHTEQRPVGRRRVLRIALAAACLALLTAGTAGLYTALKAPPPDESVLPVGHSYREILTFWSNPQEKINYYSSTIKAEPEIYYKTHEQSEGVQESDIQKTNGSYLWRIEGKTLYTFRLEGKDTMLTSKQTIPEGGSPYEMFLFEDRLAVIGTYTKEIPGPDGGSTLRRTYVLIYDLEDPSAPLAMAPLWQSGSYVDCRMIEEELYLVTQTSVKCDEEDWEEEEGFPAFHCKGETEALASEDIYLGEAFGYKRISFTMVSAINTQKGEFDVSKAVLGGSSLVYASREHLYLVRQRKNEEEANFTDLYRFSMERENSRLTGKGRIEGSVLDQFSLDESNGYLRVAVTIEKRVALDPPNPYRPDFKYKVVRNAVHVLNDQLQVVGTSKNIQSNEYIYSARFAGDLCYLVTFRKTDPLFAIDLSEPAAPKVLSELKVTGFSAYLYSYGEGLLLGVGANGDEEGKPLGWKLSMFDISDPNNVTELAVELLGDQKGGNSGWEFTSYDHKGWMISGDRNLIGIVCTERIDKNWKYSYRLFSYDREAREFRIMGEYLPKGYHARGIYAGDNCYIVSEKNIIVVDLESYEVVAEIDIAQ